MGFGFVQPWDLFLPREGGHVIGICGSGGRSDLVGAMIGAYAAAGVPVVVSAPFPVPGGDDAGATAVAWDDLPATDRGALPPVCRVHGDTPGAGAPTALTAGQVDELGGLLPDHVVIAVVDDPCPLPLRLPAVSPPAWPARTSLGIVVMGADAVGGQFARGVAGADEGGFAPFEGLPPHTVLEWDHAADLLLAPGGLADAVPAGVPAVLALGHLDEQPDSIGLFGFCERVMADDRLPLIVFCTRTEDGLEVRTAAADREDPSP